MSLPRRLVSLILVQALLIASLPSVFAEPSYNLEYLYNNVDDDGDGIVDEFNTVEENGNNPAYVSFDPNNTSEVATNIVRVGGGLNGEILVYFSDNTAYRYEVFEVETTRFTEVRALDETANLYVSLGAYRAVVVAYTGNIVSQGILK
jgi:hypothetical protein